MIQQLVVLVAENSDSTGFGYQIGYKIGEYLPVVIILILAILIIRKQYK